MNKKNIVLLFGLLIINFILVSFFLPNQKNITGFAYDNKPRFTIISSSYNGKVVYNNKTKVMYWISDGYCNGGTATLLVNADGTPMLYEEGE